MKVEEVQDPFRWGETAKEFPDYCYEQTPEYTELACKKIGARSRYFLIEDDGEIVGAAAVRQKPLPGCRFGIAYISSGPLVRDPNHALSVVEALRRDLVLRERNTLRFRPSPLWGSQLFQSRIAAEAGFHEAKGQRRYETFLIDLSQTIEVLHKNLHTKWRARLRQADAQGLSFEAGRSGSLIDRFSDLYRDMKEVKGFESSVGPSLVHALLDSDFQFEVLIATKGDRDLGGHIVCHTKAWSTYLLGASSREGRDSRVGYALLWRSIIDAQKRGSAVYDLGGVDQRINPQGFEFKSRLGGELAVASGPYEVRATGFFGFATRLGEGAYRLLRAQSKQG